MLSSLSTGWEVAGNLSVFNLFPSCPADCVLKARPICTTLVGRIKIQISQHDTSSRFISSHDDRMNIVPHFCGVPQMKYGISESYFCVLQYEEFENYQFFTIIFMYYRIWVSCNAITFMIPYSMLHSTAVQFWGGTRWGILCSHFPRIHLMQMMFACYIATKSFVEFFNQKCSGVRYGCLGVEGI